MKVREKHFRQRAKSKNLGLFEEQPRIHVLGIEVWVGGDKAGTDRSHITWALGRGLDTDCKEKPLEGICL